MYGLGRPGFCRNKAFDIYIHFRGSFTQEPTSIDHIAKQGPREMADTGLETVAITLNSLQNGREEALLLRAVSMLTMQRRGPLLSSGKSVRSLFAWDPCCQGPAIQV